MTEKSLLVHVLPVGNASDEYTAGDPGEDYAVVAHADTIEHPHVAFQVLNLARLYRLHDRRPYAAPVLGFVEKVFQVFPDAFLCRDGHRRDINSSEEMTLSFGSARRCSLISMSSISSRYKSTAFLMTHAFDRPVWRATSSTRLFKSPSTRREITSSIAMA